jgi:hypothetical protein
MCISPACVTSVEAPSVKDQVHIRNAEAAQLASALARQTGKTISEVVLDACGNIARLRPALPAGADRAVAAAVAPRPGAPDPARVAHRRLLYPGHRSAGVTALDSSVLVGVIRGESDVQRRADCFASLAMTRLRRSMQSGRTTVVAIKFVIPVSDIEKSRRFSDSILASR